MTDAVTKAIAALQQAEKQFAQYAEHHRLKGADDKAATNLAFAMMCGIALEHLRLARPEAVAPQSEAAP